MNTTDAIAEAVKRARREKYEMHVVYYPSLPTPSWKTRYIVHRADQPYAHEELTFIVTPKGYVHVAHFHLEQDGTGGQRFAGLRRECPMCHPKRKRGTK